MSALVGAVLPCFADPRPVVPGSQIRSASGAYAGFMSGWCWSFWRLDLGVFLRGHVVSMKEAITWSVIWNSRAACRCPVRRIRALRPEHHWLDWACFPPVMYSPGFRLPGGAGDLHSSTGQSSSRAAAN